MKIYSEGIDANPRDYFIYISRGTALQYSSKYAEAEEDFTKAIAIDSEKIQGFLYRAQTRYDLRNTIGALEDYEVIIRKDIHCLTTFEALLARGCIRYNQLQHKLINLKPQDIKALKDILKDTLNAFLFNCEFLPKYDIQIKRLPRAKQILEKLLINIRDLNLGYTKFKSHIMIMNSIINIMNIMNDTKHLKVAYVNNRDIRTLLIQLEYSALAILTTPPFCEKPSGLYDIYKKGLLVDMRIFCSENPKLQAEQHKKVGNAYFRKGGKENFKISLQAYRKAAEFDPYNAIIQCNIGRAHKELKNFNKAIVAFQKSMRLEPGYSKSSWHLTKIFIQQKNNKGLTKLLGYLSTQKSFSAHSKSLLTTMIKEKWSDFDLTRETKVFEKTFSK